MDTVFSRAGANISVVNQQSALEQFAALAGPFLKEHWKVSNTTLQDADVTIPRMRIKCAFGPSGAKVIRGTNKLAKPWEIVHIDQTQVHKDDAEFAEDGFEVFIAPSAATFDEAARYVIAAMCECRAQFDAFKLRKNVEKGKFELVTLKGKKPGSKLKVLRGVYFRDLFAPKGDKMGGKPELWSPQPRLNVILEQVAKEMGVYWDHARINFLKKPEPKAKGDGAEDGDAETAEANAKKDHRAITVECSNRGATENPCPVNFRSSRVAYEVWGKNLICPFCASLKTAGVVEREAHMVIAQGTKARTGKSAAKSKALIGNKRVSQGAEAARQEANGETPPEGDLTAEQKAAAANVVEMESGKRKRSSRKRADATT